MYYSRNQIFWDGVKSLESSSVSSTFFSIINLVLYLLESLLWPSYFLDKPPGSLLLRFAWEDVLQLFAAPSENIYRLGCVANAAPVRTTILWKDNFIL